MKQIIIILDSAGGGRRTKYGPCICFWAAFEYDPNKDFTETSQKLNQKDRYEVDILHKGIKPRPKRSGAIYSSYEGPNKIFYDGVIRALESCFYLARDSDEVYVIGDCKPVIQQLKGERKVEELKSLYNQVKYHLEKSKYQNKKNAEIHYKHVGRQQFPLYEDIDRLAKETLKKIKSIFKVS